MTPNLLLAAGLLLGETNPANSAPADSHGANALPVMASAIREPSKGERSDRNVPAGAVFAQNSPVATDASAPSPKPKSARTGVRTPGVQMPVSMLKPDAVFDCPGEPDWITIDDAVWVSISPKDCIVRIDPQRNQVVEVVKVGKYPSSGLTVGFGSVWVPCCGDKTLCRVDVKTAKVTATIPVGIADSEGGLTVGAGSVWLLTDPKGILARIDPVNNRVSAEIPVPPGSFVPLFSEGLLWLTSTKESLLICLDPRTNTIIDRIPVGPSPRFLACGEGSVWTLNQGDGSVSRIDAKSHKLLATIQVGVPGNGGDIAVGEGSIWVASFEFPLSRLDPISNQVVQQFAGPGGDEIKVGRGSVWLSNLKAGNVWRLDPKKLEALRR